MKISAAIMAGGKGERFWPLSRKSMPKQFLSLTEDGKTMLQLTAERVSGLTGPEGVFVITNGDYRGLVTEQLPDIPEENVICEPVARNTAPCVAVAAAAAEKKLGRCVMAVLPADHIVKDVKKFADTLISAAETAASGEYLVTVGIKPSYPETGYGYVRFGEPLSGGSVSRHAERFVEKPDAATAKRYLEEGRYLWNSGIFVWRTDLILEKFRVLMPEVYEGAVKIGASYLTENFEKVLAREFGAFPSESVDYGIMEKTSSIAVVPADFGWDDVGSWSALERIRPPDDSGNVRAADECVFVGAKNCSVVGDGRLIALVGVENLVVVDTGDAVLVCHKDRAQDVKKAVGVLRENNRLKYL